MYQRGRDYPGLHVSRSLGDYTAHRIGATSEPGIGHEKIQKYNEYLVLASKGLWNVMTPKEVFEFIKVNFITENVRYRSAIEKNDMTSQCAVVTHGVIDPVLSVLSMRAQSPHRLGCWFNLTGKWKCLNAS